MGLVPEQGPAWVLEPVRELEQVLAWEPGPVPDWAAARAGPTGQGYKECALPSPE